MTDTAAQNRLRHYRRSHAPSEAPAWSGSIETITRLVADNPRQTIDWFRVIVELERCGMFQHEIGEAAGISQAQVSAYKAIPGTEPEFHVGMMLLGLWSECVGRVEGPPLCR